jgi:hypothetical protein
MEGMWLNLPNEDAPHTRHDCLLERSRVYDRKSVFVYEVFNEFYLFRHDFVCKSTPKSHV